jgi:Fe-S cluster biogenesis protein NfuA
MPTVIYELMGGVVTTLPASPPPLTSDTAPTTLAEFHGQNAWSQAVINTTGGNVSLDAGMGRRLYTIVGNVAAPGLAGSTFTITVNGTALVLTAVAGAPGAGQFQIGTDDTAPQLAVTATNLAAAINADAFTATMLSAEPIAAKVYLNIKPACDTCSISTNANAANATSTNDMNGVVKLNGLQVLVPDGSSASPSIARLAVPGTGWWFGGNATVFTNGSGSMFSIISASVTVDSGVMLKWGSAETAVAGVGLSSPSTGNLSVTDGAAGYGRLWVGGDTVGGLGMIAAMNAGWGSP